MAKPNLEPAAPYENLHLVVLDKLNATTKCNKEPMTMKTQLKKGDRIRLVSMPQDPDPIPLGSLGTVVEVYDYHDWTQVDVDWDNGRSLMLTMPDDCVAIIEPNNHEPSK